MGSHSIIITEASLQRQQLETLLLHLHDSPQHISNQPKNHTFIMQKAKAAVGSFLSKDGKHKTTVDQDVNAAVTEGHVKPHEHETITTAVDREVHQDHHQTRIQPVNAKETLPETSEHVMEPTVHKSFEHMNEAQERQKLDAERAAFHNSSVTHDTTHSTTMAPAITGERVHHHVHEHIQPVIHKDTIAPHVVHKTVPIHETHHAAPVHHEVTTLPVKTLEEFQGGGEYTTTSREAGLAGTSSTGAAGASATPRTGENLGATTSGTLGTGERHKPSMKERLDPRVDADNDGKKGVLS